MNVDFFVPPSAVSMSMMGWLSEASSIAPGGSAYVRSMFRVYTALYINSAIALYSASAVDCATACCLCDVQSMIAPL